jgi:hypothetical protein
MPVKPITSRVQLCVVVVETLHGFDVPLLHMEPASAAHDRCLVPLSSVAANASNEMPKIVFSVLVIVICSYPREVSVRDSTTLAARI